MAKNQNNIQALQRALILGANFAPDARVLDLGWGGQAFVADLEPGVNVTFVGDDIRLVRRAEQAGRSAFHLGSLDGLEKVFDCAVYHPSGHSAKGQVFHWVDGVFEKLTQGGNLYLAGQKDRGVLSYTKYMKSVFGAVKRIQRTAHMQYFQATKIHSSSLIEPSRIDHLIDGADLLGSHLQFKTEDGVFSRDGIDPGSRLLLNQIALKKNAEILDIGCGYGLLGIVCAKVVSEGRVWMTDISARAVACARENIGQNEISNATVEVGDLYEKTGDQQFDLILSNPPFHEGNATGWPLIDGAYDRLKPNGELMLVVMRAGPYLKRMQTVFGMAEVCVEAGGYSVLKAQKKTSPKMEPKRNLARIIL